VVQQTSPPNPSIKLKYCPVCSVPWIHHRPHTEQWRFLSDGRGLASPSVRLCAIQARVLEI
jgi:hypothetical protein